MRRKRLFTPMDADRLLAALRECRRACIAAQTAAPIASPVYRGAGRLMDEIDILAETLTGDRRHFHDKPHRTALRREE